MLTGSENFPRVRVGIGEKPHPDYDLSDWVLSKFSREEAEKLLPAINQAAEAACIIAQGDIDRAMNMFSK